MWGVVKDAALRHKKFEQGSEEIAQTAPKRPICVILFANMLNIIISLLFLVFCIIFLIFIIYILVSCRATI